MNTSTHSWLPACAATLVLALAPARLAAQTAIDKANNNNALNLPASWTGGIVPGPDDTARWTSAITTANTVPLGGDLSWRGIALAGPGGDITINATGAGALTLGAGGIDMGASAKKLTFNAPLPIVLSASQTWLGSSAAGALTAGGPVDLGGCTLTISDTASGMIFIRNALANGVLSFAGNTSAIQAVNVPDGALWDAHFTGAGAADRALDLRATLTLTGSIAMTGGVMVNNAAATVTLGNTANTFPRLFVASGTVVFAHIADAGAPSAPGTGATVVLLGGAATHGALVYAGETAATNRGVSRNYRATGSIEVARPGVTLTIAGDLTTVAGGAGDIITQQAWRLGGAGNLALSGAIPDGAGANIAGVTKIGAGALMLNRPNTYTAGTIIDEGVLIAANTAGSATGPGPVAVNATGTLAGAGAIAGPVAFAPGGALAPGTPGSAATGTLAFAGALDLANAALTLKIAPDSNDRVAVAGALAWGGTLALRGVSGNDFSAAPRTCVLATFATQTGAPEAVSVNTTALTRDGSSSIWTGAGESATYTFDAATATLTATPQTGVPPSVAAPPASRSAAAGAAVTFTVTPAGAAPFTYQWFKDGAAIASAANPTATTAALTLPSVQAADAGSYTVTITNAVGSAGSAPATLTVTGGQQAPVFSPALAGERAVAYDYTGVRAVVRQPPPGRHPRIYFNESEIPAINARLAGTQVGREAFTMIKLYTAIMRDGRSDAHDRQPESFRIMPDGTRRLGNVGLYDRSTVYNALAAGDATGIAGLVTDGKNTDCLVIAGTMSLEAFECLVQRDTGDAAAAAAITARAQKLAAAMDTWAQYILTTGAFTSSNDWKFGGHLTALAYDMNHWAMTDAQRAGVLKALVRYFDCIRTNTYGAPDYFGVGLAPEVVTSNWVALGAFRTLTAFAIEGDITADAAAGTGVTNETVTAYIDNAGAVWHNFLTYGWHPSGAGWEGQGKNYLFAAASLIPYARRGCDFFGHPHLQAYARRNLPAMMQPYGYSWTLYDLLGGSGADPEQGKRFVESLDYIGLKWMLPDDPAADFMWRNFVHTEYKTAAGARDTFPDLRDTKFSTRSTYYNQLLPAAIFAADPAAAAGWQAQNTAALGALDYIDNDGGTLVSRSGYDAGAAQLIFHVRQDFGGHTFADRNTFALSALGRLFINYNSGGSNSGLQAADFQNIVLVDGKAMAVTDTEGDKCRIPAKLAAWSAAPAAAFATGDATYAYSNEWWWGAGATSLKSGGFAWENNTLNTFRRAGNKIPEAFGDWPFKDFPNWNAAGKKENIQSRPYNPMRQVIRTAGLVRGPRPYALIIDDIRKDDAARTYKWLAHVPADLALLAGSALPAGCNAATDVVLAEPAATGDRRLLVRILRADGTPKQAAGAIGGSALACLETIASPNTAETWNRLVIERASTAAPNYRVLLYPFRAGDPLPATTLTTGASPVLTVTIDGGTDTFAFNTRSTIIDGATTTLTEFILTPAAGAALDYRDIIEPALSRGPSGTPAIPAAIQPGAENLTLFPAIPEPAANPHVAAMFDGVNLGSGTVPDVNKAGELLTAAYAFLHPSSPHKNQQPYADRALYLINEYSTQWTDGTLAADDMAPSFQTCLAYYLFKLHAPGLLAPEQQFKWEAAIKIHRDAVLANADIYTAREPGAIWLNGDIRKALGAYFGSLALGDAASAARARAVLDGPMTQLALGDGGTHYVGYQNENYTYHAASIEYMAWWLVLTGSPSMRAAIAATKNYAPITNVPIGSGFGDYSTSPAWKPYYNRNNVQFPALVKAYLTGDPYNCKIGLGAQHLLLAFLYTPGLAAKDAPAGYTLYDRNILGPRGTYGPWGYTGSARDVSSPAPELPGTGFAPIMDGMSTFAGAYILNAAAAPNEYPLDAAFHGAAPQVKTSAGAETDWARGQKWKYLTGKNARNAVTKSREIYGLSTRYTIAGNRFAATKWDAGQLWVFTPSRVIGLSEITATAASTAYGLAQRIALVSGRTGVSGVKKTLQPAGAGHWTYGGLQVKVHASTYAGAVNTFTFGVMNDPADDRSTMIELHDAQSGSDTAVAYPQGATRAALIETTPAANATAANVAILALPAALRGFEFEEPGPRGPRKIRVIQNITATAVAYAAAYPVAAARNRVLKSWDDTSLDIIRTAGGQVSIDETIPPHAHLLVISGENDLQPGFKTYDHVFENAPLPSIDAPAITTSPPATLAAALGETVTLSVTATGTPPLSFQWEKDGAPIPGATTPSLELASLAATDAGAYTVTITNGIGGATSTPCRLYVLTRPQITRQPLAAQTVITGKTLTLAIALDDTLADVQWQYYANGAWHNLADDAQHTGASATTLAITAAGALNARQYRCIAANLAGSATSNAVTLTVAPAHFSSPVALAIESGTLLHVADDTLNTIQTINLATLKTTPLAGAAGQPGLLDGAGASARFNRIQGITTRAGTLYAADTGNAAIRAITPGGTVGTHATLPPSSAPAGIAADPAGNLYIADAARHAILKLDPARSLTAHSGAPDASGSADGPSAQARYNKPASLAIDPAGNLYTADTAGQTLRKIAPDGAATTIAGQPGAPGNADGPGALARFHFAAAKPAGLACDASTGNLYLADTNNNAIRLITPAGEVLTIAGEEGIAGNLNAPALDAQLNHPQAVAIDPAGNLYIADTGNSAIRKLDKATGDLTTLALTTGTVTTPGGTTSGTTSGTTPGGGTGGTGGGTGGSGGGGGGGASSLPFLLALSALAALHPRPQKRRQS
jgi:autotransporter-associated beta strand protein